MKERDFYFDNAKFILIFFVVFGHLLTSYINKHDVIHTLYMVIYTFHMPAFIFASGFFARGFYQKGYVNKLAKKLILPYLIFQFIYSIFYYFLYNETQFAFHPFDPHWSLWFLISLFFWHLLLFGFSRFKPVIGLTIALIIALFVGYLDWISTYLSLSRTFVFFPMFLLGYYLTKEQLYHLTKLPYRLIAIVLFIAAFIFYSSFHGLDYGWLFGSKSYSALGASGISAMFTRLGFYLISTIIVFSLFALIPKRKTFFTDLGKNTLYVYLLHGFIIRIFRESAVVNYFNEPSHFILLGALALLLTLFLSSKLVTTIAEPLLEFSFSRTKALTKRLKSQKEKKTTNN